MKEIPSRGGKRPAPALSKGQAVSGAVVLAVRLESCWETYRLDLQRCRDEFTEPRVHDLRVAARRLSVALEMGASIARKKRGAKHRRLLKSYLNAFDHLRDIQVQLAILEELPADDPEIEAFRAYLLRCQGQTAARLSKKVRLFQTEAMRSQVLKLSKALHGLDRSADESALCRLVDAAYAIVCQRRSGVRLEDALTIHRLRLSFKKFRYQVETIFPLLPGPPKNYLDHLQRYQAAMGEIQDAEIGLLLLKAFSTRRRMALPGLQAGYEDRYHTKAVAFLAGIDAVDLFWRHTPRDLFPWELDKV